ncbi:hypothetical protein [Culicoidibacter larvae]|nr:hypothetical protein [Culicoidibacter larvae]
MDKFLAKDTRNNFEDAESMTEAKQMAESWMEEALEYEDTDTEVGIYQLVKVGKFVKDDGATEDYLEDCENDGVIPEYEYIVKSEMVNVIDGDMSDGYHTFNELYNHRSVLFSVICNLNSKVAWKSKKHADGSMFNNMFVVGIETPAGMFTYHDEMMWWNRYNVPELENAPEWDGHTSDDVIRLYTLVDSMENDEL